MKRSDQKEGEGNIEKIRIIVSRRGKGAPIKV